MKLAIVDDNSSFRNDLKFFLENKLNHSVIAEAWGGEELLQAENFQEADIILMDLTMKPMNGFEATRKVLELFPQLKIVAITMDIENVVLLKLIDTGFRGFIFKSEIYSSLEKVLQSVYTDSVAISDRFQIM